MADQQDSRKMDYCTASFISYDVFVALSSLTVIKVPEKISFQSHYLGVLDR